VLDSTEAGEDVDYVNVETPPRSTVTRRDPPLPTTERPQRKSSRSRKGRRLSRVVDYVRCKPPRFVLSSAVRGQGVGAERDENQCEETTSKTTSSSAPPLKDLSSSAVGLGYQSLDDVPLDVSSLSVEEVLQCLRWLKLHEYIERFRADQVDGRLLVAIDRHVLLEEFGFKRIEAIKLEMFARSGWRPKRDRASLDQPPQPQQQQPTEFNLQLTDFTLHV